MTNEDVEEGQEVYAVEGGKHVRGMVALDKKNLLPRMLHFWKMKMFRLESLIPGRKSAPISSVPPAAPGDWSLRDETILSSSSILLAISAESAMVPAGFNPHSVSFAHELALARS